MARLAEPRQPSRSRLPLLLLLIPFVGLLWPAFYAGASPALDGIPFFYWYQFLWVIISTLITAVVYFLVRQD